MATVSKVLFLTEKYCDADPACGPTGAEHQVVGAVKSTGLVGETKHFYFDVLTQQYGRDKMEELLWEECMLFDPDLIIYTPLGGALGERLNPRHSVMQKVMNTLDIKVFLNLWDAPEHPTMLEAQWLPSAHMVGIVDLLEAYHNCRHLPNVLFQHSTPDPTVFYDRGLARDIDVSFVGSLDPTGQRWPLRWEYIQYLKDNGIKVLVAGGQRTAGRLSIEEYASIMCRSKISLDFCQSSAGKPTMHLRSFEVPSCGALLMEDGKTLLTVFLDPAEEFAVFHSKEHLLQLVKFFLSNESRRQTVAHAGWGKMSKVYNALNMWGLVFERMGFAIPEGLAKHPNYLAHKRVLEAL